MKYDMLQDDKNQNQDVNLFQKEKDLNNKNNLKSGDEQAEISNKCYLSAALEYIEKIIKKYK